MTNCRKPKISVIGTRGIPNIPGGVEIHSENLYKYLSSKAIITIYARRPYFPRELRIKEWKNIKVKYVWCLKIKLLETIISSLMAAIDCLIHKPDIAHFHNIGSGLFIPLVKLRNIKTILTYHSMNFEHEKWGFFSKKFLKFCEYVSIKYADEIIAISPIISKRVLKKYGIKSFVIPNGVHYLPRKKTNNIIEQFHCLKEKYILYVGRIAPEKCVHTLINSFINLKLANCNEFYKEWKLVIIGNMNLHNNYARFIHKLAVTHDDIIFTGYLSGDGLSEFYSHAAVFVLPSKNEGHPLALLEAMSYRLPCLVSDIPEMRLFNFDESFYFEVKNSKMLEKNLTKIINSKEIKYKDYELQANNWNFIARQTYSVLCKNFTTHIAL